MNAVTIAASLRRPIHPQISLARAVIDLNQSCVAPFSKVAFLSSLVTFPGSG